MSIGFEGGGQEFHTTTAHAPHEFALPELLKILTALAESSAGRAEYLLQWNRDPEAYDFLFRPAGRDVTLDIYQFPTDERRETLRELVFSYTGDALEVCRAFEATFAQLFEDRDTDEFEFNWRQPFPLREFEEFRDSLDRASHLII
jgi:hypothetical protein